MKVWLHRIRHEAKASDPLLKRGFLTIGFAAWSNAAFLQKAMAASSGYGLDADVVGDDGKPLRGRHNLWRFLSDMCVGDLVLVPGLDTPVFSVYQVKGEARCVADIPLTGTSVKTSTGSEITLENGRLMANGGEIDLGFFREVSVHQVHGTDAANIGKRDYADRALTARMKIRQTNADISDLEENLKEALDAYHRKAPLRLYSHAKEQMAPALLKAIHKQLEPNKKFEELLKWYFERLGAIVDIPGKNERDKEGDADIIASFDAIRFTIFVQAKFHDPGSMTDDWAVRQIDDYVQWAKERREDTEKDEDTTASWVISTGDRFTDECVEAAKAAGVVLINGIELAQMLLDVGLERLKL